ncbi:hypothetical protein E6C50_01045 [Flavobacterium supellecticarium]|uniref:Uncharacterized protein n=1 Tax=Flavobacterium supellecticarium TaxID=2565924 RepID=A0A4S4A3G9_9FLAO|nr:hypothetical protein [Flavobacterium supellecticarium]THF52828.1 hypothetical protein E6C50_01045 [Flavobacterium supellecticarium]
MSKYTSRRPVRGSRMKHDRSNETVPSQAFVSESDAASMEFFVHNVAKKGYDAIIPTINSVEKAIVMAEIFKHAKREVKIYDYSLTDYIAKQHTSFYTELQNYLKSGKLLKIILQNDEKPNSSTHKLLAEYAENSEQVQIKVADNEIKKNMAIVMKRDVNFIVNDQAAYRFELAERHNQQQEIDAIYSFNDKDFSEKLNDAFDFGFKQNPKLG